MRFYIHHIFQNQACPLSIANCLRLCYFRELRELQGNLLTTFRKDALLIRADSTLESVHISANEFMLCQLYDVLQRLALTLTLSWLGQLRRRHLFDNCVERTDPHRHVHLLLRQYALKRHLVEEVPNHDAGTRAHRASFVIHSVGK
jgi:hypothetical protein